MNKTCTCSFTFFPKQYIVQVNFGIKDYYEHTARKIQNTKPTTAL